ncbi:MAG: GNAT family N-acetyltransferase [Bacteroidota bacterium]
MSSGEKVILRPATIADIDVLRSWDEQPHVIDSSPNDVWDWEYELPRIHDWRELLIAEVNGRPVGFVQIIDPEKEETHYWGDAPPNLRALDIWIGESTDLNKGYGTQMMQQTLERCFSSPEVTAVIIDPLASNTNAIRFYQRMGFVFTEYRWFAEDYCAIHQITRNQWEALNKK